MYSGAVRYFGMERGGEKLSVPGGHDVAVHCGQNFRVSPDFFDVRRTDESHGNDSAVGKLGVGIEASELSPVSVSQHPYIHGGEGRNSSVHFFCEDDHSCARAEYGESFGNFGFQGIKNTQFPEEFPHNGAFAAGDDKRIELPLQIPGVSYFETVDAKLLQYLLVLEESTLQREDGDRRHFTVPFRP